MLIFCYFFFMYFNIINLCVRTTFCFLILIMYSSDTLMYQSYLLCMDNVSFILVFLTIWLIMICYMSVDSKSMKKKKIFFFFLHILQFSLTMTFLVKDILMFYFMLEMSFLPMFYIIIGWGNMADRLVSGYYLMFYTMLGSLPLFNNIMFLNKMGLKTFYLLSMYDFSLFKESFFFFFLLIFMVKFPIYGMHLWLLKAHVEAPVMGSMLLAGIMLKLGGYGMIRFYIIYENMNSLLKNFFFFFSLWGGLLMSFICLSLNDIKLIVASSSIVHMSYCISSLMIVNELSLKGSMILMVGHGLCSSGLFYMSNKFYTIFGSRSLSISKGLLNVSPILTMFWFMMCSSNMGCPPSFNLLAELSLISFMLSWSYMSLIFISSIFFFSSCYSLYMYYIYSYNYYMINMKGDYSTDMMGYFISSCHWVPLNLIFISFFFFLYFLYCDYNIMLTSYTKTTKNPLYICVLRMYMTYNLLATKFFFIFLITFSASLLFSKYEYMLMLEWDFFFLKMSNLSMKLYLDFYGVMYISIISLISSKVIYYSNYYMGNSILNKRFIILICMFIYSMLLFILSPSLLSMMLGWDGLGFMSYLLICYYSNNSSLNSGMITIISNRLGDMMLITALSIMWMSTNNFSYFSMFYDIAIMFIMFACFTKSAQMPFCSWLPFAMAAPTPVSSLVHSSTLVTAGIFVLFRLSFMLNDFFLFIMYSSGLLTMVIAGICGMFEVDLKKVIALSTLSQLGLMMTLLGNGAPDYCFFHLIIHALFKSSLFMSMGHKIHENNKMQDSRVLTNNWKNPLLGFSFSLTNMSLMGFPFMSGFYSKDLSLESCLNNEYSLINQFFVMLSIMLTLGYSMKFLMVSSVNKSFFFNVKSSNVVNMVCFKSLIFLLLMSLTFGYIYYKLFFNLPNVSCMTKIQKMLIMISLITSCFFFISNFFHLKNMFNFLYIFKCIMTFFYLSEMMTLGSKLCQTSFYMSKNMDSGWLEGLNNKFFIKQLNQSNMFLTHKTLFNNFSMIFYVLIVYFLYMS